MVRKHGISRTARVFLVCALNTTHNWRLSQRGPLVPADFLQQWHKVFAIGSGTLHVSSDRSGSHVVQTHLQVKNGVLWDVNAVWFL
jgi:hypothetical protein